LGEAHRRCSAATTEDKVIPRLFEILKGCVGWKISRIGDLDVEL
jgi:hypothetical protein